MLEQYFVHVIRKRITSVVLFYYSNLEQEVKTNVKIIQKGLADSTDGTHLQSSVMYSGYDTNLSNFGKWYL